MKIAREDMTRLTAACARIADDKSPVPAHRMINLSASEGLLRASATDGEYWLTLQAPCEGDLPPVLAPAGRLADTVAKLTADVLDLSRDDGHLHIKAKGSRRKIAVLPTDSFPAIAVYDGAAIPLDAARLVESFQFCQPFASSDTVTQAYLCGINLNSHDGRLYFAASDGHTAAEYDYGEAPDVDSATVPTGFVSEAVRLGLSGEATLTIGARKVALRWAEGELIAPRIDQAFVNYRRIIPADTASSFTASSDDISKACRGVAGLGVATGKFGAVITVTAADGSVELLAQSHEGQAADTVDCAIAGDVPVFGVSSAYLDRAMRGFNGERITVGVNDAVSPLKLTSEAAPERLAVIMPRRI